MRYIQLMQTTRFVVFQMADFFFSSFRANTSFIHIIYYQKRLLNCFLDRPSSDCAWKTRYRQPLRTHGMRIAYAVDS